MEEHLKFEHIPITGTLDQFAQQLVLQNYRILGRDEEGLLELSSDIPGYGDVHVKLVPIVSTNLIYAVIVILSESESSKDIDFMYNSIKDICFRKYGVPLDCEDTTDCNLFWNTSIGNVQLGFIQSVQKVFLLYVDKLNSMINQVYTDDDSDLPYNQEPDATHLTFEDVPINGTCRVFARKLCDKGYRLAYYDEGVSTILHGSFANREHGEVALVPIAHTDFVYQVIVKLPYAPDSESPEALFRDLQQYISSSYQYVDCKLESPDHITWQLPHGTILLWIDHANRTLTLSFIDYSNFLFHEVNMGEDLLTDSDDDGLQFLGIPLVGTPKAFAKKLLQKGFSIHHRNAVGEYFLTGRYAGYEGFTIRLYPNPNAINSVIIELESAIHPSLSSLMRMYNSLKEFLIVRFGNHYTNLQSPAKLESSWLTPDGTIQLIADNPLLKLYIKYLTSPQ